MAYPKERFETVGMEGFFYGRNSTVARRNGDGTVTETFQKRKIYCNRKTLKRRLFKYKNGTRTVNILAGVK